MFYRLEILSAWPNILNFKNSQSSRNLTILILIPTKISRNNRSNGIRLFMHVFKVGISEALVIITI